MKITFSARHFEPSEKLQKFAQDELSTLEKYFSGDLTGEIMLNQNGNLKEVEMRIHALGKVLPSKVDGDDFYKIIPAAVTKLEKQLKAEKSKKTNH